MTAFPGLAARLQAVFTPQATALAYRTVETFTAKVSGGAALGATSLTLGTLSSGLSGVQAGDTFAGGAYQFTAATAAAGGSITAAPITPSLTAAMASGAPVQIVRAADEACLGWVEWLEQTEMVAEPQRQRLARVTVLADSLSARPVIGGRVVSGSDVLTVKSVGADPAGTAWSLLAVGS